MKTPREIMDEAISEHFPIAFRVGISGGKDSVATADWMMENVPGCELFHINTGIGIERTREFVRDLCKTKNWPLTEIRAKEDCGQDYDAIVKKFGFPGPKGHQMMYSRLKERAIRKLVRDIKHGRKDRILIATGIRHDESVRRMRYVGREVNRSGAQVWVNPIYWWTGSDREKYIRDRGLPVNPVSFILGMSGECLCGAFANPGEKELIRLVCPRSAARIDALEVEVKAAGHPRGWEERPKAKKKVKLSDAYRPLCVGCEKVHMADVETE